LFFKNAIEIFKSFPIPEVIENPPISSYQSNPAQAPTLPPIPRNSAIPRKHPEQFQSVINIWIHLLFYILGDEKLTEKLHNTLYLILGNERTPKIIVRTNLTKKNIQRIQRRKVQT
jgi:hypothetical protein